MGMMQQCSVCKSYDVAEIQYGLICEPDLSDILERIEDRGDTLEGIEDSGETPDVLERRIIGRRGYHKTVLGGCCVGPSKWECVQCGWQWPSYEDDTRTVNVRPWTEYSFCSECGGLEC